MHESDQDDQEWHDPADQTGQAQQEQPSKEADPNNGNDNPDTEVLPSLDAERAEAEPDDPRQAQLERWLKKEKEQSNQDKILVRITTQMLSRKPEFWHTPEEVEALLAEVCDYQAFLEGMNIQGDYRVGWMGTLRRIAEERLDEIEAGELADKEIEPVQPPTEEELPEYSLPEEADPLMEQFGEWAAKEKALPNEHRHDRLITITDQLTNPQNKLRRWINAADRLTDQASASLRAEIKDLIRELQMYKEFIKDAGSTHEEDTPEADYRLKWLEGLKGLAVESLRDVMSNDPESVNVLAEAEAAEDEPDEEHFESEFRAKHIEPLDEMMNALPLAEFQEFMQKENLDIGVLALLEKHLQSYIKSVADLGSNLETSGFAGAENFQITPYVEEATKVLAAVRIRMSTEQTRENINSLLGDMKR